MKEEKEEPKKKASGFQAFMQLLGLAVTAYILYVIFTM